MKAHRTGLDVRKRLWQWAEVTSLSLKLLEASIKKEHPRLSSEGLRRKLVERLHAARRARLPEE